MGAILYVLVAVIAVVVTLLIAVPITRKIAVENKVRQDAEKVGTAEEKARNIIDEALKTASELQKKATGKTVYILDEPTTGLHSHDVARLIEVLNRIVEQGDTVIVIEHNLDVIKVADHIIDLGLEGGDNGGTIVVSGTPEKVAACQKSHTGRFLKMVLE